MDSWFDRIKKFYDIGYWVIEQVADGVKIGRITEKQFTEITKEYYDKDQLS